MKLMNKTLLFIPMYNCKNQIVRVLSQLDEKVCRYISEVIVVDNGSTDGGRESVKAFLEDAAPFLPRISLLLNDENYGLGGSHKVAFNYAVKNQFDYVIVLHGDDQGDIKDLLPYLRSGMAYKYDSFLGSRFEKNSVLVNYAPVRIVGNHIFNVFMTFMLGRRISDLGSGLNMYRVNYLRSGFYRSFTNTLSFNVYMLIYGIYSGSRFRFFPLSWREDDQVSNARFLKQTLEIAGITFSYLINKRAAMTRKYVRSLPYSYSVVCDNRSLQSLKEDTVAGEEFKDTKEPEDET